MYDVLDVARYIVNKSNEIQHPISNLKLQKVLYFVQGVFYHAKNVPCFNEEIEAWDFGPVVPEAYKQFKFYGSNLIPPVKEIEVFDSSLFEYKKIKYITSIVREDQKIINDVLYSLKDFSASHLVEITHNQGPWQEAYFSNNKIIKKEDIQKFFCEEL